MPITKTCVICGKEFQAKILWEMTRNTCSEQCRYKLVSQKLSTKIMLICPICGKEFTEQPSYKKVYCSRQCRKEGMSKRFSGENNPYWKETKSLRQGAKRSLRKHIIQRDNICQRCGSNHNLQVHHMDKNPKNNNDANLILLCKLCHSKTHQERNEPEIAKLILANRTYNHHLPVICKICGKSFIPKHSDDICCSRSCAAIQSGLTRRKK
jgi:predicted nucleic acid-binding Zn ribbon protein